MTYVAHYHVTVGILYVRHSFRVQVFHEAVNVAIITFFGMLAAAVGRINVDQEILKKLIHLTTPLRTL